MTKEEIEELRKDIIKFLSKKDRGHGAYFSTYNITLIEEFTTQWIESKLSQAETDKNLVESINHYFPNSQVVEMLIPEKYKEEVEQFLRNKLTWQNTSEELN